MEKIRIIPKIEIKNENCIKGIQYEGLRIIGKPKDISRKYFIEGADQLIVMDIVASLYSRENLFKTVDDLSGDIFIPITAGGGIKKIEDIKNLLLAGADRVCINTELLENSNFIEEVASIFGNQFLSVTIDVKKIDSEYFCMKNHGRDSSGIKLKDWLAFLKKKNVAEILIYSVDNDGLCNGPDLELLNHLNQIKLNIPCIYGGGLLRKEDMLKILRDYDLSGISISTSIHFNKIDIKTIKNYLKKNKININET